jgi:hypothetical protein
MWMPDTELPNSQVSPLFLAAIESVEEAIYNSLCMAHTVNGFRGTVQALPLDEFKTLIAEKPSKREQSECANYPKEYLEHGNNHT